MSDYVIHLLAADVRISEMRGLIEFEKTNLKDESDLVMMLTCEQAVDLAHALIRMAAGELAA